MTSALTASSGWKGTVTATKAMRHRLYSVILVRNPRMIFLLKGTRLLPAGDTTPY